MLPPLDGSNVSVNPNGSHSRSISSTNHPSIQARTIAQSPDFSIQTALLWVRFPPNRATSIDSCSMPSSAAADQDEAMILSRRHTATDLSTTTTIDESLPDLGLLPLHRDRLATAAESLGWRCLECFQTSSKGLDILRSSIQKHIDTLVPLYKQQREYRKLRIGISKNGDIRVDSAVISTIDASTANQVPPFMPASFEEIPKQSNAPPSRVYIDTMPTKPSTFTTHKTTHRAIYDDARARAKVSHSLPTSAEVLLYNLYSEVMETSVCTVYFKRGDRWITPAAICGGNLGVSRRLALEHGLCKQGVVELKDVRNGEEVWLSNAVRGFFRGRIEQVQGQAEVAFDAVDWATTRPNIQ